MNPDCDRVLAVCDLIGDEAQRVHNQDHVTRCLKGVIEEPLLEKEVFETVIPIDSSDESSDLVADTDVGVSERAREKPITDVVGEAGTVFKFVLTDRKCSDAAKPFTENEKPFATSEIAIKGILRDANGGSI